MAPQTGWVEAVRDTCAALDAAVRWWLDEPDLEDRVLFVWHEVGEIRSELGRHLDPEYDPIPPLRGSDPARALMVGVDHLAVAIDHLGDPDLAAILIAYAVRLRRLSDRTRR